jgi:hypothetical protein
VSLKALDRNWTGRKSEATPRPTIEIAPPFPPGATPHDDRQRCVRSASSPPNCPGGQGTDASFRTNDFQLEKKRVAAAERSGIVKRSTVGLRHRLTKRLPAPFATLTPSSTARFSRAAPATSNVMCNRDIRKVLISD